MATPNEPAGQQNQFTVTHPTDPSSPRIVTQQQWKDEKLGQAGWVKVGDENTPVPTPLDKP